MSPSIRRPCAKHSGAVVAARLDVAMMQLLLLLLLFRVPSPITGFGVGGPPRSPSSLVVIGKNTKFPNGIFFQQSHQPATRALTVVFARTQPPQEGHWQSKIDEAADKSMPGEDITEYIFVAACCTVLCFVSYYGGVICYLAFFVGRQYVIPWWTVRQTKIHMGITNDMLEKERNCLSNWKKVNSSIDEIDTAMRWSGVEQDGDMVNDCKMQLARLAQLREEWMMQSQEVHQMINRAVCDKILRETDREAIAQSLSVTTEANDLLLEPFRELEEDDLKDKQEEET